MTKGNGRDELHVGKARKRTHKRVTNEPLIIKQPEHTNTALRPTTTSIREFITNGYRYTRVQPAMILPRGQHPSAEGGNSPYPESGECPTGPPLPDLNPATTLRDAERKAGVRAQLMRPPNEHKIEVCWVSSRTSHGRSLQAELQARLLCPSVEVLDPRDAGRPIMRLIPGAVPDSDTRETWSHFLISLSFRDAYLTQCMFSLLRKWHVRFSCVTLAQAPYRGEYLALSTGTRAFTHHNYNSDGHRSRKRSIH